MKNEANKSRVLRILSLKLKYFKIYKCKIFVADYL